MGWRTLRRTIVVLGLGMFGLGLAVGSFGTYVSYLVRRGVAPETAGLGSTLFLLGQLVIVLPADRLSRRLPIQLVTAGGLGIGAVAIVLGGVPAAEWYLFGRFLLGIANGVVFLLVIKYAGLRVSGERVARLQGVLGALFTFGLAVGVASSPAVVARVGPRGFAAVAATLVAVAAVATPTLPTAETGTVPRVSAYVAPFSKPSAIALGLANAASYGLLIVALTWYTDIVSRTPVLPVTVVLTSFAVATFVGRTGSGWLTAFTSEARAVAVSLLFLSGALALVSGALATGSAAGLAAGLALTGFGFGFPFGPLFSLAFADIGADAGVLLVGMTALGNAAALVYPWLVGRLLAVTDAYVAAFVLMAGSVFVVVLYWQFAVDSRTTVGDRSEP